MPSGLRENCNRLRKWKGLSWFVPICCEILMSIGCIACSANELANQPQLRTSKWLTVASNATFRQNPVIQPLWNPPIVSIRPLPVKQYKSLRISSSNCPIPRPSNPRLLQMRLISAPCFQKSNLMQPLRDLR